MKEEYDRSFARLHSTQKNLEAKEQELEAAKQKGVALMKELADRLRFLESWALSFKKSTVNDYVNNWKMRNEKEKLLGWSIRNSILDDMLSKSS